MRLVRLVGIRAAGLLLSWVLAQAIVPAHGSDLSWLDRTSGESTRWVQARNAHTLEVLRSDPRFAGFEAQAAAVLTDPTRLEPVTFIGEYAYQYWQSRDRPLGVWRRTLASAYLAGTPAWQTVIDVQALANAERVKLIFAGASCRQQRCLVRLSHNGKDAVEIREFDLERGRFVRGGFRIPESKSDAWWYDDDTLIVAPAIERAEMTSALLPRTLKLWRRGETLAAARRLFEVQDSDAAVSAMLIREGTPDAFVAVRELALGRRQFHLVSPDGRSRQLALPDVATIFGVHAGMLLLRPNEDWTLQDAGLPAPAGSLIAVSLSELMQNAKVADVEIVYTPEGDDAVLGAYPAGDRLLVELFSDYASRFVEITSVRAGTWAARAVPLPAGRYIELMTVAGDRLALREEAPLSADRVVLVDARTGESRTLYEQAAAFDTSELLTEYNRTRSPDGEMITYSLTRRRGLQFDRCAPTLVYGYGGFDIPLTPRYEPLFGKLWLERGGVYVHAYLRGGGEHGPSWHRSAMGRNRQLPYDDMRAVLEDLHRRGVTQPARTGIIGRSNGGLMVAAVMQQQPLLMNAVIVGGPLTDMIGYVQDPPGSSWAWEYGDPREPEAAAFLRTYSPMQTIAPAAVRYPVALIITSTDDDRVLPGQARRYSALLEERGHDNLYFEDAQGGHYWELAGGPAPGDWSLRATARAVEFTYLWQRLGADLQGCAAR